MSTDLLTVAKSLLIEAASIAKSTNLVFTVAGGWSPYLRNSYPIPHPGTLDVDLLFKDGIEPGSLEPVILEFIKKGYVYSAKHSFQLLKVVKVNNKKFVFNVDLMHPKEEDWSGSLMIDHMDAEVLENAEFAKNRHIKSIALPSAELIFPECVVEHNVTAQSFTGEMISVSVPLIDEAGTFITKFKSVESKKRPRDAFDIYLSLTQPVSKSRLLKNIRNLRIKSSPVNSQVKRFEDYIVESDDFNENVNQYSNMKIDNPRQIIKKILSLTV